MLAGRPKPDPSPPANCLRNLPRYAPRSASSNESAEAPKERSALINAQAGAIHRFLDSAIGRGVTAFNHETLHLMVDLHTDQVR